jgi:HSP20 family molecular chaperone IbpA
MDLFPRAGDFAPLFRLLDDYDLHRSGRTGRSPAGSSISSFSPRFDVRESKDAYHLDGELPGIAQKDIEIEFSDPQTLAIKGRAVREYHSDNLDHNENTPKPASVEDASESSTAVQKADDKKEVSKSHHHNKFKYWVSERSVGEFHRSFNFPTRVDQDGVKASLKNGILSVTVPKAAPPTSRKISIE